MGSLKAGSILPQAAAAGSVYGSQPMASQRRPAAPAVYRPHGAATQMKPPGRPMYLPQAHSIQQKSAPAVYRPQPIAPAAYRPAAAAQKKPGLTASAPAVYRPQPLVHRAAPPVYRPTVGAQKKPGLTASAPAVYRPQPSVGRAAPQVYRPATAAQNKPAPAASAPPVYHPQFNQPQFNRPQPAVSLAPAVYRPIAAVQGEGAPAGFARQPRGRSAAIQRMEDFEPLKRPIETTETKQEKSAGTKPLVFAEHGRYIVKLGSAREQFVYEHAGQFGLSGVMPKYYKAEGFHWKRGFFAFAREIASVVIRVGRGLVTLNLDSPLKEPSSDQKIIVIDTLGGGQKAKQSFFIDIKIGTFTKSGEQFNLEGASAAWRAVKWAEHDHKDASRGNRQSGFDMDAKGRAKFESAFQEAMTANRPTPMLDALFQIVSQIEQIQLAMQTHSITFVGSSVLCYFNLSDPSQSEAKLIDPDHPIVLQNPRTEEVVPDRVMNKEHFDEAQSGKWLMSERRWDEYSQKWTAGFEFGLRSLHEYFDRKFKELAGASENVSALLI